PFALRNRMLQLSRACVVQIQVSPVLALREPQNFLSLGEITPVHMVIPALEESWYRLCERIANRAGGRIRYAHRFYFVIARGRNKRQRLPIGSPLHILPAGG